MKKLLEFPSDDARKRWQSQLQGDRLGFVIFAAPALSFSPVHRVLQDPELGPVILLGDTVFEVDIEADVYPTREAAASAYYETIRPIVNARPATLERARQRLIFFVVDREGMRTPMPDLYWFEENMVRTLDDRSPAGHRVEWEVVDE